MNLNKLLDFWNSRQPRERLLVTILAMILIIFLATSYIFSTINSISTKTKALESSKNDFNYVLSKAKNAAGYQKTQRAINDSVSLETKFGSLRIRIMAFPLRVAKRSNIAESKPSVRLQFRCLELWTLSHQSGTSSFSSLSSQPWVLPSLVTHGKVQCAAVPALHKILPQLRRRRGVTRQL